MPQSELLRLERIEVDNLFGTYDHRIELNLEDRVTLLHGPNGVGKTVVLQMINALLRKHFDYFRTIPFSRFLLGFDDGSTLTLTAPAAGQENNEHYVLTLSLHGVSESARVNLTAAKAEFIASRQGFLRPHETMAGQWVDVRDGELLSSTQVVARFDAYTPASEHPSDDEMPWFDAFLKNANAHLIEAQRLVQIHWNPESGFVYGPRRSEPTTVAAVVERSHEYNKRLGDTMAQYGRQSQALDQTFPQRLLSATEHFTETELQDKMSALDQKTSEFKTIGILDETPTYPFPVENLRELDSTQARVMTLYVRDTEQKLQALDDLATRTAILLENVNTKFRHKRLRLDRDVGFVAESDYAQILPLSSLSSGEQHELVLHYDLLFRVPSNTIVLIDEPELSLHVAWQKRFLIDLLQIVRLTDFDALVATHSPFIVGDREELMVGLGDPP